MTDEQRYPPLEPSRLKALAHPLRTQLLDALTAYGPATASALGERLGESSGATSYHLRQLEKADFVREDTTRGSGRERWWERIPQSISIDTTGLPEDSAERAASQMIEAEWERTRRRRLSDFVSRGERLLPREWWSAAGISSMNMWLTSEQLRALRDELSDVAERYKDRYRGQTGEGVRSIEVHLNLFPIVDAEERRDVGGREKNS
jgi:DNA-binding transcriptional ArsR family regulator